MNVLILNLMCDFFVSTSQVNTLVFMAGGFNLRRDKKFLDYALNFRIFFKFIWGLMLKYIIKLPFNEG